VPGGEAVKYGAVEWPNQPAARVYILGNTFWSDQTDQSPAQGIVPFGAAGPEMPYFYLRNNIVRVADKAARVEVADRWDEDNNDFSSSSPRQAAIVQTPAGRYRADATAYRAGSGQGTRTNIRAGFGAVPDTDLVDPANGDLHLRPGSALVDQGAALPNIADRAGIDFTGGAPDVGALESAR
jgi:hypothetical protein